MTDINNNLTMTEQRFEKIMIKFLLNEPFFATIVRHMRKQMTTMIPTAGVAFDNDSIILFWNQKFVSDLPTPKVFGLLKHECYHLIYQHLTSRKQEPHLLWNIATDLAINSTIPLAELPDGGLIPGQTPKMTDKTSLPPKLAEQSQKMCDFIASLPPNKSSEWYMEKIQQDPDIQQAIEDCMGPQEIGISCDGSEEGSGIGEGQKQGTCAGFDYHFDTDKMSEGDKALIDAKVKEIVKEAVERADRTNSWGSVSASQRSKIKSLLNKTVDWKQVLYYFCGTKQRANKSRSFKKINRKYPYIHPGRKISHTSNIAVYIDQSGSVGHDDLRLFFGALNDLARNVTFTIYHFDWTVDEESRYTWKKNKKIEEPYRTRGGGTCFDSVENHFRRVGAEFDGYIIMTDGYAPKPKTCISKRCWVLLPGIKPSFEVDDRDTVVLMERNKK